MKNKKNTIIISFISVLIISVSIISQKYIFCFQNNTDIISYYNMIISLCVAIAVLWTLSLQIYSIKISEDVSSNTNFNDIFFNIIDTHNNIKNSIKYKTVTSDNIGVGFFNDAVSDIYFIFDYYDVYNKQISHNNNLKRIYTFFENIFNNKYKKVDKFYNITQNHHNLMIDGNYTVPLILTIFINNHIDSCTQYITHFEMLLSMVIYNKPKHTKFDYIGYIKSTMTPKELLFLYIISGYRQNLQKLLKETSIISVNFHHGCFKSKEVNEFYKNIYK